MAQRSKPIRHLTAVLETTLGWDGAAVIRLLYARGV